MLAALLAAGALTLGRSPGPAPSILVVVIDDVAAADLAIYGGPVAMPCLESLASRGVVFDRAYANATCSPSRRSLQTGRWWIRESSSGDCGISSADDLPDSELTLAEILPSYPSALIGKWHLGADPLGGAWECAPVSHGYDYWLQGVAVNPRKCGGTGHTRWMKSWSTSCSSAISTEYQTQAAAITFCTNWPNQSKPALTVFCATLAHGPFAFPPRTLLPTGYPRPLTERGEYEAMLRAMDTLLGAMLKVVDESSTLVIVVGDNGTPSEVAPNPARAKDSTFERGVRVPLVVAGAGTLPGRAQDLVHLVDVWATVLDVTGQSVPTTSYPVASVSLAPILRGDAHAPPHDVVMCGSGWGLPGGDRAAITAGGLKLRQVDDDGDGTPDLEELYDLFADPAEMIDVSQSQAYQTDALSLRAWLASEAP